MCTSSHYQASDFYIGLIPKISGLVIFGLSPLCLILRGETIFFHRQILYNITALLLARRYHRERCHGVLPFTTKTTSKWCYLWKIQDIGEKSQPPRREKGKANSILGPWFATSTTRKPRRGLKVGDTRMTFPCPFCNVMIAFNKAILRLWIYKAVYD